MSPGRCRRRQSRSTAERGAVTAELVVGLPVLLAVTLGLVWLLAVGAAQIRTVDAAREAARAVARGDDPGAATAAGERVAPDGVSISVTSDGEHVVAVAAGRMDGPGGVLGFLAGAPLRAEAVALVEEGGAVGGAP
ncbi:TadE family type IV pilus minor pilin [Nocardioides sambongensis]|uniref:TadE family type IV pilus minor pilin n=1 Tax=Nocardioides sambongensis TaxID=2589074 RepID=UPI00112E0EAB|nr:TadE family type IV pilus minor pilin [Nocardioides sambongensis]